LAWTEGAIFTHPLWSCLLLGLLVVLGRRCAGRLSAAAPLSLTWDLGLAIGGGLLFAGLSQSYLADSMLRGAPVTGADFHDYCSCIGAFRGDHIAGWRSTRSVASGILPSILATRLGVIDGLLAGAFLSQWVMGTGISLWARALHSRLAGLGAVLLAGSVAPLVSLSRSASFYPEVVAVSVLSAALCVLALRSRSLLLLGGASVSIGVVLLMDVRGLVWACFLVLIAVLAAVRMPTWRRRGAAALVILMPLAASYQFGEQSFLEGVPSLERQMDSHVDDVLIAVGMPPTSVAGSRPDHGVIWGRTSLTGLPGSMLRVLHGRAKIPSSVRDLPENIKGRGTQILPWFGLAGSALLIVLWGLRRRPELVVGMLLSISPFLLAISSAGWFLYRGRYLASGLSVLPLVMGLALGVLTLGSLPREDLRLPFRPPKALPVVGLGILLLVLGVIPSWLSPTASWRWPVESDNNVVNALRSALTGEQVGPRSTPLCTQALQADLDRGLPAGSRLLGWSAR
jgi:hypothetical protein